ncbi:DUF2164 domain-containing protein [Terriglobus sp. RCC_193]|uniref:DUF2164 domain-containing protein n=1 Tax=Terriglobus sp. RCC_193 TaxID=3239218 RepID=UPI00352345B2
MPIELNRQNRTDAIASLKRYFEENLPEPIGDLPAGMLLDYILQEIGPLVYNQAIGDAQARLSSVVTDLTGDLYEKPLAYWPTIDNKRKRR